MADDAALVFALDARIVSMERALARAEARAARAAQGIEGKFRQANRGVEQQLVQSANGFARLANVSGATRFVIQNTANQFGDLAVQLAMGTSASRALGQQLPQLLGGFGALGGALGVVAPLLGAVAAIGIPVGVALASLGASSREAGSGAEEFKKQLDALRGSVDAYRQAAQDARVSSDELAQVYGSLAGLARTALDAQEAQRLSEAQARVAESLSEVRERLTEISQINVNADVPQALLDVFFDSLGASAEQVAAIQQAITSLEGADGIRQQALAAAALQQELVAAFGPIERMPAQYQAAFGFLNEIVLEAAKLNREANETNTLLRDMQSAAEGAAASFGAIGSAAQGMVGQIADAVVQTIELARAAAVANANVNTLSQAAFQRGQAVYSGRGGDPRQFTDPARFAPGADVVAEADRLLRPPSASAGRRSGGGGGVDPDLARARQLFEQTRTEAERYAAELAEIERLYREGDISSEVYTRALEDLKTGLSDAGSFAGTVAGEIQSAFSGLFDGILSGSESAADALGNLGRRLASLALQRSTFSLLARLLPGTFGAGGFAPLTASANGNAFLGGRVTPFASGGVVTRPTYFPMRGGTGLMGEAGPEAILPLTRINGKLGVRAQGGGGGSSTVVQINDMRGSGSPVQVQRSTGPSGEDVIVATVRDAMARGEFAGALGSRHGVAQRPIKR